MVIPTDIGTNHPAPSLPSPCFSPAENCAWENSPPVFRRGCCMRSEARIQPGWLFSFSAAVVPTTVGTKVAPLSALFLALTFPGCQIVKYSYCLSAIPCIEREVVTFGDNFYTYMRKKSVIREWIDALVFAVVAAT